MLKYYTFFEKNSFIQFIWYPAISNVHQPTAKFEIFCKEKKMSKKIWLFQVTYAPISKLGVSSTVYSVTVKFADDSPDHKSALKLISLKKMRQLAEDHEEKFQVHFCVTGFSFIDSYRIESEKTRHSVKYFPVFWKK